MFFINLVISVAIVLSPINLYASGKNKYTRGKVKNMSGINYIKTTNEQFSKTVSGQNPEIYLNNLNGVYLCSSSIPLPDGLLEKIKQPDTMLEDGIPCTIGDFDGNGYLDFVLWGTEYGPMGKNYHGSARSFMVILYDKNKIVNTFYIGDQHGDKIELYKPTRKKGKSGAPPTFRDGLIQWGEGGANHLFVYDTKKNTFKHNIF